MEGELKGELSFRGKDASNEVFSGRLNKEKTAITITGRGAYSDGHSSWSYEFYGPLKATESTVLKGTLTSYRTGATRDCSILFYGPGDKLVAALTAPNSASTAAGSSAELEKGKDQRWDDLAAKQKQLQAAQNDLLEQQKALKDQQKVIKQQHEELALAAKNLDEQRRALEAGQQVLAQEQAKTSKDVNVVQNLMAGIILPSTEDPKSWMLRVASVPVQQQQFGRIADQFYDSIAKVYEIHNEIKRNSLFRDGQQSMAALLPHDEFSNWVVQVKEVTQAPDGSAAVMRQPPCRVMLGSDACQQNGSKIQATILPSSATYRKLEKVSAGDFVVASGKILYVGSDDDKPLPAYAVYQAGLHCSTIQGSKQETEKSPGTALPGCYCAATVS